MAPYQQNVRNSLSAALVATNALLAESRVFYDSHAFESMPSHFGMSWTPQAQTYEAHLQVLSERAKLCPEEGIEEQGLERYGLVAPNDTLPVALLVERGNCSFEDKATVAMQAYPTVSFLVVYDDQPSKNLVSMRETYADHGIKLGMLFVSYHSGMMLREALKNQTQDMHSDGGPIIHLDGDDPLMLHEPSLKDLQTWILIAMGGFFTFITVFGCLLVFVQLGVIPVNGAGQIIFTQEALRRSRRLLTKEEVARLQPGGDLFGKRAPFEVETQPSEEDPTDDGQDCGGNATESSAAANPPVDPEEDQTCAVCLDELSSGEDGENWCLPCGHKFHVDCIVPWLTERHANCPLCKYDLLELFMELEEKKTNEGLRFSIRWCKQQARRMWGWSLIRSSDSHAEESATSNPSEAVERRTDASSDATHNTPL